MNYAEAVLLHEKSIMGKIGSAIGATYRGVLSALPFTGKEQARSWIRNEVYPAMDGLFDAISNAMDAVENENVEREDLDRFFREARFTELETAIKGFFGEGYARKGGINQAAFPVGRKLKGTFQAMMNVGEKLYDYRNELLPGDEADPEMTRSVMQMLRKLYAQMRSMFRDIEQGI